MVFENNRETMNTVGIDVTMKMAGSSDPPINEDETILLSILLLNESYISLAQVSQ